MICRIKRGMKTAISDRKRAWIFINIIISSVASSLMSTALNTALAPMTADLGVSITTGQWIVSGYSLALGIITPVTAFLIRRFRTKRLYITGIVIFMIGLVIGMTAGSFPALLIGRILQACGNGILVSMSQVIVLTIYPKEKKGTMMGWYGLAINVAPVIAPTIGGILVDQVSWRAIFGLGLIVMGTSLVLSVVVFENVLETQLKKFDVVSFLFCALAFGGVTLGIGNMAAMSCSDPSVWLALLVGVVSAFLFVRRQLRTAEPLLDMQVLKSREYVLSVISAMLLYMLVMASAVMMPLYVQTVMGYSATVSGLVTLPGSLAMAICSPFAGRIYDRLGIKNLFLFGSVLMFLSNLGMYFITMNTPLAAAAVLNVIRCMAVGCLLMPLTTWGTSYVGKALVADATALITAMRVIAGAIGSALFVGIMMTVAEKSAPVYGTDANIHGVNTAYLILALCPLLLFIIGVFFVKRQSGEG